MGFTDEVAVGSKDSSIRDTGNSFQEMLASGW